jgi:Tfp pilus assembly protein PilV
MRISNQIREGNPGQRGFMLLELMISMIVLTVGLGGLLILLITAMYNNKGNGSDTISTMIAEHVLEQISSQLANDATPLQITDCAGTVWNISTAPAVLGAGSGANGGNGANLAASAAAGEVIDWTQTYAAVPAGYKMQYVACGNNGRQETYDVRWNLITMSVFSRMVLIAARPAPTPTAGVAGAQQADFGLRFVNPVTLRTINGM